jgi:hypothetical protein
MRLILHLSGLSGARSDGRSCAMGTSGWGLETGESEFDGTNPIWGEVVVDSVGSGGGCGSFAEGSEGGWGSWEGSGERAVEWSSARADCN